MLWCLQEVEADGYNTALCLMGQPPVVGSSKPEPNCTVLVK